MSTAFDLLETETRRLQENYVEKTSDATDAFVESAPVVEEEPAKEEKTKSSFSAYSSYFNLVNKKN